MLTLFDFLVLLLAGIGAGVLGGLLGIGGGLVFVFVLPVLLTKLGLPPDQIVAFTIANSLFATVFVSLSANIRQIRWGQIQLRPVIFTAVGSVFASVILLHSVVNKGRLSMPAFNLLLIVLCLVFIRKILFPKVVSSSGSEVLPEENNWVLIASGLTSGIVSALSGLGGGVILVPVLHTILKWHIKKASAVSLANVGISALFSTLFNLSYPAYSTQLPGQIGYILFPVSGLLGIGGFIGSYVGVGLSQKTPAVWVGRIFAALLALICLQKGLKLFE